MKKLIFLALFFLFLEPASVFADGTLYHFDASAYYLDKFGYCNSVPGQNPCASNVLPTGKTFQSMTDDFDRLTTLVSIQGLVNRSGPKFWLKINNNGTFNHDDVFWSRFRDGTKSYGFLAGHNVVTLTSFDQVLQTFANDPNISGSVGYTVNKNGAGLDVATTVAGADNLVINRKGSTIYAQVAGYFPEKVNVPYFDSKRQTYEWAIANYLSTGKSNPAHLGYFLDAYPLVLYKNNVLGGTQIGPDFARDLFILNKGFAFDLSPWGGEKPVDDLTQNCGDDLNTFKAIFQAARNYLNNDNGVKDKMITVWGYLPWQFKYDGNLPIFQGSVHLTGDIASCQPTGQTDPSSLQYNDATYGEEKFVQIISGYGGGNGGGWSSDLFGTLPTNTSVMHWGKLPGNITNPPAPTRQQLISKGYILANGTVAPKTYVLGYFGDYEQGSFISIIDSFSPRPWSQGRGTVPAIWGINPDTAEQIPAFVNFLVNTRSNNDYFSSPFGATDYVYPNFIPENLIPEWKKHNAYYYSLMNISQSMVVLGSGNHAISAPTGAVSNAYASFSPQGINTMVDTNTPRLLAGVPASIMMTAGVFAGQTASQIADDINTNWNGLGGGYPKFLVERNTWHGPGMFKAGMDIETQRHQERNYTVVDPYTFYYLLRLQLGGNNDNKATFTVDDSFPSIMTTGQTVNVTVHARNDGWNDWVKLGAVKGSFNLGFGLFPGLIEPTVGLQALPKVDYGSNRAYLDVSQVGSGQSGNYSFNLTAPSTPGTYYFRADIVNELNYWFEQMGNLPVERKIVVTVAPPPQLYGDFNKNGHVDITDLRTYFNPINGVCVGFGCTAIYQTIFDYANLVKDFGR